MSDEFGHGQRLTAVEGEMQTIRTELGVVKADVKGLGAILGRIEQGILRAQEQEAQSRLNPVTVISVLITIVSILVGGAWLISGSLAATSVKLEEQDKQTARLIDLRNREFDQLNARITRLEPRRGEPRENL